MTENCREGYKYKFIFLDKKGSQRKKNILDKNKF